MFLQSTCKKNVGQHTRHKDGSRQEQYLIFQAFQAVQAFKCRNDFAEIYQSLSFKYSIMSQKKANDYYHYRPCRFVWLLVTLYFSLPKANYLQYNRCRLKKKVYMLTLVAVLNVNLFMFINKLKKGQTASIFLKYCSSKGFLFDVPLKSSSSLKLALYLFVPNRHIFIHIVAQHKQNTEVYEKFIKWVDWSALQTFCTFVWDFTDFERVTTLRIHKIANRFEMPKRFGKKKDKNLQGSKLWTFFPKL